MTFKSLSTEQYTAIGYLAFAEERRKDLRRDCGDMRGSPGEQSATGVRIRCSGGA
ncbi:hypothetical protein [Paenibacillus larvae]|uniref:hypothetical protein n=1 Tax=Paenibacillus larvae TaxID=1464 RepID=UPI00288F3FDA|nr:hypothetical protein [Paenibacillus larvae]MDT2193386.1 hypothetical protein [Paenibacillus larvae]